ncbi:unnamed protein product, partial [Meganyctiphanes norvegica]
MESYASVEMEDYWNEVRTIRRSTIHHQEEDHRSHDDDAESDETFLEELGIPFKGESELSEDNLSYAKFAGTLNPRQEEALKRRVRTVNATLRKKKLRSKNQKPDIRNFFANTDNSSTGTRSRSATPDSLDSVSPPRTPPDPNPKAWVDPYLSRSRGSLDSGNHSLVTSPSIHTSPGGFTPITHVDHTSLSVHHHHDPHSDSQYSHHRHQRHSDGRRLTPPDNISRYGINLDSRGNSPMYRAPSLDLLPKPTNGKNLQRQRSYARDIARDMKQYYSKQGLYEFNPAAMYDNPPEIKVLGYRHIGSVHIPHARCKEKRPSLESYTSTSTHHSSHDDLDIKDPRKVSSELRKSHSIKLKDSRSTLKVRDIKENKEKKDSIEKRENQENRPRSTSTTDLGFKIIYSKKDEEFPGLVLELPRSGQSRMDWLVETDLTKLSSLALLELDILFTEQNINHRWRKLKKKKHKEADSGVFGVDLETLLDRDRNLFTETITETNVPLVLYKLVWQLERHGLREEGILRVPGHRSKTEHLRKTLDSLFYSEPASADAALRGATANDVASLIKTFLRELPRPLLTETYMPAFYKAHRIQNIGERVMALTMLVLLLPRSHRDTLFVVLELCANITQYESKNKMSLYNVAMIMAPNLFLPHLNTRSKLHLRSEDKEQQLNSEMTYASVTTQLTQALIKYREIIWTVPHRLMAQIRRQYQAEALRQQNNNKPMRRLLSRKSKMECIQRPIENEVDYQEGVLRVSAPQFNKLRYPVKLDAHMTAKDMLTRFIEELTTLPETPGRVEGRREQQYRKGSGGSSSIRVHSPQHFMACILQGSMKNALEHHAVHERGGNIGE